MNAEEVLASAQPAPVIGAPIKPFRGVSKHANGRKRISASKFKAQRKAANKRQKIARRRSRGK